jgi:lysophospholipase L1-like esterase
MRPPNSLPLISILATFCFGQVAAQETPVRWEQEIRAYEAADRTNPPPRNGILFIGSSSIRLWKSLAEDFKGLPVINRGFGGSQMNDTVFYADRLVLPHHPRQVLVYAGDNDLAAGKSPEHVLESFQALVAKLQRDLPEARIAFISIKPSPARWNLIDQIRAANHLILQFTHSDKPLAFIDVFTPMLGEDGKPREALFAADKLHLNRAGYDLWTSVIRPYVVAHEIKG